MDGKIIIGTDLNTKEFDKKIIQLEKKAEKKQIDIQVSTQNVESTKKQLELVNEELESVQNQLDGISKDAQRLAELEFKFLSGETLTSREGAEYFGLSSTEIAQQEQELLKKMQKLTMQQDTLNTKLTTQNQKLREANNAYDEIQQQIEKTKLDNVQKGFDNIGNSVKNITKKIVRCGLAVFSIRSAYMAVRNAINVLTNDDAQLKADIDYMRAALAYTLEPVVRTIVNLAKQLLMYLGYIIKVWTGKNIFEKANKSLKGANSQAQKLSKTLAGFDEMNVVNDNTSSGGGGGASTSFEMPTDKDMEGTFIGWIAKNKDIVIAALLGIAAAITTIKLGLTGLLGGSIVGLVTALVYLIIKNWDVVWKTTQKVALAIWEVIKAVATSIWETIKGVVDLVLSTIDSAFSIINGIFTTLIEILKAPFVILWETVKGVFDGVKTTVQGVFNVIKGLFIGDWQTVMNGFKQIFRGTFNTLWSIAKAPLNLIIDGLNALIKGANKISFDVPKWVPVIGGKKFGFDLKTIPRLAKGTIVNAPGRGVLNPSGTAIYGESGREAYLPLSDTALLEELGSTIGKYININATIPVYVGNRQIAREIQKINAESDFAMNR